MASVTQNVNFTGVNSARSRRKHTGATAQRNLEDSFANGCAQDTQDRENDGDDEYDGDDETGENKNNDDDDDDDEEFPSIEELFKNLQKSIPRPKNLSRKRKTSDILSPRDGSQKRKYIRPQPQELVDLTSSTEHCAICPNILKEGDESTSRVFLFTDCGCVICGECFLSNILEQKRNVKPITEKLCCPKYDHSERDEQSMIELFGTDCPICMDDADGEDRISTPCGHSFCRACFDSVLEFHEQDDEQEGFLKCPRCKNELPPSTEFISFQTVQRGVVSEVTQ